jgi:hypothetical protein
LFYDQEYRQQEGSAVSKPRFLAPETSGAFGAAAAIVGLATSSPVILGFAAVLGSKSIWDKWTEDEGENQNTRSIEPDRNGTSSNDNGPNVGS